MKDTSLHNTFTYLHPTKLPLATYERGSIQLNYILFSSEPLPFLTGGGIEAYDADLESDHKGLWINYKLQEYLNAKPITPTLFQSR